MEAVVKEHKLGTFPGCKWVMKAQGDPGGSRLTSEGDRMGMGI